VMAFVGRVVDFSVGAMAFVEEDRLDVDLLLQRPVATGVIEQAKARLLDAVVRERSGQAFTRVQARLFPPPPSAAPEETVLGGFAHFPVVTNGRLSGLLAVTGKAAGRLTHDSDAFMHQVANQAYIVVENSRLFERVRSLSVRDSLTDLYNHRYSISLLGNEFDRVGRYEEGVGLLMIDIDHFKEVNDRWGHPVGDSVLREVASILKETLRAVDAVGRYGGEEFMVILPHTDRAEALQTAERVRRRIEGHQFRSGDDELRVTVSVGVACYPAERVESPAALIREADKALYKAKEGGRNRVA
jgi:diguanylate cyclase (GGDEF)-like protein